MSGEQATEPVLKHNPLTSIKSDTEISISTDPGSSTLMAEISDNPVVSKGRAKA